MKTSERLQRALSLLNNGENWGKNYLRMRKHDNAADEKPEHYRFCLIGANLQVLSEEFSIPYETLANFDMSTERPDVYGAYSEMNDRLSACIRERSEGGGGSITGYNDYSYRTWTEVETVARCAIENAQAQEMEVPTT
jgi:hypothetical protein